MNALQVVVLLILLRFDLYQDFMPSKRTVLQFFKQDRVIPFSQTELRFL